MARIIALSLLIVPGIVAAVGIKLMRDTLFDVFHPMFMYVGIQFAIGFILFLVGIAFITGFIVHRDRKKHSLKKNRKQDD